MENEFINKLVEKLGGVENIKEISIPGDGEITNIVDIKTVLKDYLFNNYYDTNLLTIDNIYYLLDNFQTDLFYMLTTQWLVTKGTITGTFPKRVAKYFKQKNIFLDSKILGKIGDIAKNSANINSETYFIDITNNFDWKDGDFGDDGSCFWGGRSEARKLLKENGGYALRYYKKEPEKYNFRGMGRCWFFPIDEKNTVIFNQYPSNFKLVKSARILSTLTGYNYQRCYLENNGEHTDLIYINNGIGYVLSKEPIEEDLNFDLRINTKRYRTCVICGDQFDEDYMYISDGNYVCEDCWGRYGYVCDYCEENFIDYIYTPFYTDTGETLCPHCTRNYTWTCEICENTFSDNVNFYYVGDYKVCRNCYDNRTWSCEKCGEIYLESTEYFEHNGNIYCEYCYQNILKEEEEKGNE